MNMKIPLQAIPLLFLAFFPTGCQQQTAEPLCAGEQPSWPAQIVRIEYGTSFGFCAGYCWSRIVISGSGTSFRKGGWHDSVEEVTCTGGIPCHERSTIAKSVSLSDFFALDEIIGCPDCADGGAEWIEIETQASTHRVTYEYGNPPAGLESLADRLGDLQSSFADCK